MGNLNLEVSNQRTEERRNIDSKNLYLESNDYKVQTVQVSWIFLADKLEWYLIYFEVHLANFEWNFMDQWWQKNSTRKLFNFPITISDELLYMGRLRQNQWRVNFAPYRRTQWCHSSLKVPFNNCPKIIQFAFPFELWKYIKYFQIIFLNKKLTNSITGSARPSFVQLACSVPLLHNFLAWTILLVPRAFPVSGA